MKRISHPNINMLYEAIETDEQVILVLEYVPGGSTQDRIKRLKERFQEIQPEEQGSGNNSMNRGNPGQ